LGLPASPVLGGQCPPVPFSSGGACERLTKLHSYLNDQRNGSFTTFDSPQFVIIGQSNRGNF
jgi:hypothetical protein